MKRDWRAAREKVDAEGCRVCGSRFAVEAAHIVSRARLGPGPAEDPLNIVPLCGNQGCDAHRSFDEGSLDLLPFLSLEEQGYVAKLVGIAEAFQRTTNARLVA